METGLYGFCLCCLSTWISIINMFLKVKKKWNKGIEMLVGIQCEKIFHQTYLDFELHTAGCNVWWALKPKVNEWMTQPVHIRYTVQRLLTDKIRSVLISKRSLKRKIKLQIPIKLTIFNTLGHWKNYLKLNMLKGWGYYIINLNHKLVHYNYI